MAAAHAYFDESGTHDGSPVLCVAGYVIPEERRQDFNTKWIETLESKGLTHFHMVDCAHGNGEFANLGMSERIEVQTKLIELIKGSSARGIGAMIVASVYKQLMPFHPNMGSAYNYSTWRSTSQRTTAMPSTLTQAIGTEKIRPMRVGAAPAPMRSRVMTKMAAAAAAPPRKMPLAGLAGHAQSNPNAVPASRPSRILPNGPSGGW